MRPFNLEEYLKDPSRKVVTRDGHDARILCIDRDNDNYPIIALYTPDGTNKDYRYGKEH